MKLLHNNRWNFHKPCMIISSSNFVEVKKKLSIFRDDESDLTDKVDWLLDQENVSYLFMFHWNMCPGKCSRMRDKLSRVIF
jgi:hypothetical protein